MQGSSRDSDLRGYDAAGRVSGETTDSERVDKAGEIDEVVLNDHRGNGRDEGR